MVICGDESNHCRHCHLFHWSLQPAHIIRKRGLTSISPYCPDNTSRPCRIGHVCTYGTEEKDDVLRVSVDTLWVG